MKKVFILCIVGLLSIAAFSQETDIDFNKIDLTSLMKEDLYAIFPSLTAKYGTPLLKKTFEKSDEYKVYLSALQKAKEDLSSGKIELGVNVLVQEYDLAKKGFSIILGRTGYFEDGFLNVPYNDIPVIPEKVFGNVYIPSMKYSLDKATKSFSKITIFVPCEEEIAVKIEEANRNGELILKYSFIPQKVISQTTNIICETRDGKIKKMQEPYDIIQVENVNVIFYKFDYYKETEEKLFSFVL